ncbi:hypothetical protein [Adhaeribacter aquaticus]|uniref:plasmid mobilization protein n=1 Tax=Adhaeribacter aquaticus TaxID=299567 RepID=UPI00040DC663|nr:hypothetical protein [Adhaeribacter aquaticus]
MENQEIKEEPKPRNRGGRKKKDEKELAKYLIGLKVVKADFGLLENQFKNSTYTSKTDMYYDLIFNKKIKVKDGLSLELLSKIQTLTKEINAIGTNYNQVVKKINSLTNDKPLPFELSKLVNLTEMVLNKQSKFNEILLKLRERWLQE